MADFIFERIEKKYILNPYQYAKLMLILYRYMELDEYGKHTISNIYFDTEDYALIRKSLEKPVYKEKLRLRAYRIPKDDSDAFIEIKKKYKGVVYKRRIGMKLFKAEDYLYSGICDRESFNNQIFNEIDYMKKMYTLFPRVYIAYDRRAFFGKDDPDFRITFDENIVSRSDRLRLGHGSFDRRLLDRDFKLMEVKIQEAMPLWLSKTLSSLEIYSTSYSKYGEYYKQTINESFLGNREVRYVI